ncbi:hypothetical protein GUJ93_ZPchr0001g29780 [Zizania palustris]|uniref:Uncharacterized protein n=1 Tax=Zizania palustris TaxID=103762 RepID=A0A8J5V0G8_ZIZPA|nr:hypothetical protein GUJ93_ZPchr0001g29780 [Zizania palustris]
MELSASVCSAYLSSAAVLPRRRRQGKAASGAPPQGLGRRCHAVLKQHKTRLYILGRCVSMLLCWHHHDYSD